MARPKKTKPPPAPLGEALVLATMCMVGLPVEVQVRDGSAYAGVFHTACVDGGYGVVLKKARKIANGKDNANLSLGAFVDTLLVLSDDLVQVIAKDFVLPTKGVVAKTPDCDVVAASEFVKCQSSHLENPKAFRAENVSPSRQVKKHSEQGQESDLSIGETVPMNCKATSCLSSSGHILHDSKIGVFSSSAVGSKGNSATNLVSTMSTLASDVEVSQPANNSAAKVDFPSKTTAKDSKLNPCAKVFSPSFTSSRPLVAAAPTVNSNYISNSLPEVPTGVPLFGINSASGCSSLSSKVVHYNTLTSANYGISPQYVQPIMGHNVAMLDPSRVGTPYQPVQLGPTYISPSAQPVMAGKFSPVVYVHPVSQDAMQGTPVIPQGLSRPVLTVNSYQASLQKFQGATPVYVAPPAMATGNLPLVVQSPAPLVQSFPPLHPVMVPAGSSMILAKYM